MKRVVVTGIGLVTPLGNTAEKTWQGLLTGKSGIISVKNMNNLLSFDGVPSQVAGIVQDFNPTFTYKDKSRLSPFMNFAMEAAHEAILDSGYSPRTEEEKESTGVCIGSGIGSLEDITEAYQAFKDGGYKKVSPSFVPKLLINLAAGHISMNYGFKGPIHACSTACATGANAIGDAMRFIQYGDANVMIAGGTEAAVSPLSMAGFSKVKALSTKFNDDPKIASRPFDKYRDGFVISEGSGVVVLEEYEHAKRRGARIYAEIKGYGICSEAYHYTAPSPDGNGAYRAMKRALQVSNASVDQLVYINAHATSTPLGDLVETRAIHRLLSEQANGCELLKQVAVSSSKGHFGHLLGAAGAVEAIITILSLYHVFLIFLLKNITQSL